MEVKLKRLKSTFDKDYVIGKLYINDVFFCNTLEDKWRNLSQDMTEEEIKKIKVKGQTCIPRGRYRITLNIISPKFYKKTYYKRFCNGKLPRLIEVKQYQGVLMHKGSTPKDTEGCILLGFNEIKGMLLRSQEAFEKVYNKLKDAKDKSEEIWINIVE